MNLKQKLSEKQPNITEDFMQSFFFLCVYKMFKISKEARQKCEIEIIDDLEYFWINRRDLEIESDYKN